MPAGHPDLDDLIVAGTPLPVGHPIVDNYMCSGDAPATGCSDVFNGHPAVHASLTEGEQLPSGHPLVDPLFRKYLPDGHEDCDAYIAAGTPIPDWHPNIDNYLCERSIFSAGVILGIWVGSMFAAAVLYRYLCKYCNPENAIPAGRIKRVYSNSNSNSNNTSYQKVKRPSADAGLGPELGDSDHGEDVNTTGVAMTNYQQVETTLGDDDADVCVDIKISAVEQGQPELVGVDGHELVGRDPILRMESFTSGAEGDEVYNEDGTATPSKYVYAQPNDGGTDFETGTGAGTGVRVRKSKPLPRRNRQIREMEKLHANHKSEDLYEYGGYRDVPAPKSGRVSIPRNKHIKTPVTPRLVAKSSSYWGRMMIVLNDTRIPYFDWNLGQVLMVVGYLLLNWICLLLASEPDAGMCIACIYIYIYIFIYIEREGRRLNKSLYGTVYIYLCSCILIIKTYIYLSL